MFIIIIPGVPVPVLSVLEFFFLPVRMRIESLNLGSESASGWAKIAGIQ